MLKFSSFLSESKEPKKTEEGHVILSEPLHFKFAEKSLKKTKDGHVILQNALHFKNNREKINEERTRLDTLPHTGHFLKGNSKNHKLSEKLRQNHEDMSDRDHKLIHRYTSDSNDTHNSGAFEMNRDLIKGKKLSKKNQKIHDSIHKNAKTANMDIHLYSGTKRDFSKLAKKSKDNIIHSPAHISATHSAHVAHDFATGEAKGSDAKSHNKDLHIVHIHVKPHNKILHVSHISNFPGEHETIIPSGSKLKYSHTTDHTHTQNNETNNFKVHHFEIHSQE